jgi:hypothetical protein
MLGFAAQAGSVEIKPRPEPTQLKTNVMPVTQPQPIPRTDIALHDVWLEPDCTLKVAWQNTGNQRIENVVLKELVTAEGLSIPGGSMNRVALDPGAYFSHAVGAGTVKLQGTRTVTAVIDADNVLKESNEANNTKVKTLTCGQ